MSLSSVNLQIWISTLTRQSTIAVAESRYAPMSKYCSLAFLFNTIWQTTQQKSIVMVLMGCLYV